MPSSAETNGAAWQQGDISHGAQNTGEEPSLEKLPEVCVAAIHLVTSPEMMRWVRIPL